LIVKRNILTVEDIFSIQGRGLVIVGRKTETFVDFKIGDLIEIENPDETVIRTKVKGLEFISRINLNENSAQSNDRLNLIGFLIEDGIEKSLISKEAIIWLLDEFDNQ